MASASEIEERGEDEQSGNTEEKEDSLESDDTEEENGSSESALAALVKKRKKELVEGERALKRAMLRFDKEKKKVYGDAAPSDVLHLNVGGTKMTVLRSTLTSVPGSMLASKFSGHGDDSIERDRDGNFFIDEHFPVFEVMVNHLRAKASQPPNAPPLAPPDFTKLSPMEVADPSTVTELDFRRMLEYYGMVLGIYPAKIALFPQIPNKVEFGDDLSVNTSDWKTFGILPQGHKLTITSFEVTILKVERAQIGWREPAVCSNNFLSSNNFLRNEIRGVGDIDGTVALDCCRSVMVVNGALLPFDGTCKEGSTIRCEDKGNKWYIDGRLVASTDQSDEDVLVFQDKLKRTEGKIVPAHYGGSYHNKLKEGPIVPTISAKGSFYVSNVEYCLYDN
jgi:hypothetical protein